METVNQRSSPEQLHSSLFAQALLAVPGPLSELIYSSLLAQPSSILLQISQETTSSHVLQASLSLSTSTYQYRRKIINSLKGYIAQLAVSIAGSHVVDALWTATQDKSMTVYRERIAEELVKEEESLRESKVGRSVWRNWKLDLYKRQKMDWLSRNRVSEKPISGSISRSMNALEQGQGHGQADSKRGKHQTTERGKRGIDLAREKFAARKSRDATRQKKEKVGDDVGVVTLSGKPE